MYLYGTYQQDDPETFLIKMDDVTRLEYNEWGMGIIYMKHGQVLYFDELEITDDPKIAIEGIKEMMKEYGKIGKR